MIERAFEWLKTWWAYLTLLGTIAGTIYAKLIVPVVKRQKEKKKVKEAQQQKILDTLADIKAELKDIRKDVSALGDDVGTLQHDRLQQGYRYYMKRGWCESAQKESLTAMFDAYTARGRNHLYASYRQDLEDLPEVEPGINWGARQN